MYKKFKAPIILGHNLDDSLENIFSNIKKTRNYDNLRGMRDIAIEDDCVILRPMLNIPKSEIINFANRYMIPYLEDSTPKWSERGRMRDHLIPFIDNFDNALIPGLLNMTQNFQQIYRIYQEGILETYFKKIKMINENIIFELDDKCKSFGFTFWKDIIKYITKTYNKQLPSNKAIENFTKRIENSEYGRINLCKNFTVIYNQMDIIF